MKKATLLTFLLIFFSYINSIYAAASNDKASEVNRLLIEEAWIAEAPPVSKVMVAYMRLINTGTKTIEIIHAESSLYSSIEFHETIHENGLARMIRHHTLKIPANNKLELKPGGPHIMLFNPTKRLTAGSTADIKLTTKNNKIITVTVPVKKAHYN
jgi:copper(I)-binding protein